jgi:two-component system, NarL family, nitrate/nitrite response regulator NarL
MSKPRQGVGTSAECLEGQDDRSTEGSAQGSDAGGQGPRTMLILSDIRFFREGLAEILKREGSFAAIGLAANIGEALAAAADAAPRIILIDVALPDGLAAASRLRNLSPQPQIVALALAETEPAVIAWAEAGVSGYVPRSAALSELVVLLEGIMRGEQACSGNIAAGLLRWISQSPRRAEPQASAADPGSLTVREEQVVRLIGAGLSNKEIARQLKIGLGTTKSHVHNVLGKLELQRRSQVARWIHSEPVSAAELPG